MIYLFKTLLFIFLTSASVVNLLAQENKESKNKASEVKSCNLSDMYKGFRQIDYKEFTVCIPAELKEEKVRCIDGGCSTFKSEQMIFKVDLSADAWRPTFEKSFPSYKEENSLIDNKKVWIWYFEQEYELKYILGGNFQSGKNPYYDLGIFVFYKNFNQKEAAEKIIKSVKFK